MDGWFHLSLWSDGPTQAVKRQPLTESPGTSTIDKHATVVSVVTV